jgi:ligand-binding sensor domain-containing protein
LLSVTPPREALATLQAFHSVDGLGAESVLDIHEDAAGQIWFAGAVTRYDGSNWRVFGTSDGLQGPYSSKIVSDGSGGVYCVSLGNYQSDSQLMRFDGTRWTPFVTAAELGSFNGFRSAFIDSRGRIWLDSYPVMKYSGGTWSEMTGAVGPVYFEDRDGGLWFGGSGQIARLGPSGWTNYVVPPGLFQAVQSMAQDDSGHVWIGTVQGLYRFDGSQFVTVIPGDGTSRTDFHAMIKDSRGIMWFGADRLLRYNGRGWQTLRLTETPFGVYVTSLTEDSAGNLWIGTGQGAYRYTDESFQAQGENQGQFVFSANAILADRRGDVWVGGYGLSNLSRFDGNSWISQISDPSSPQSEVRAIAEAVSGDVWFASSDGMHRFDGTNWTLFGAGSGLGFTYRARSSPDGSVWAEGSTGLCRFDGSVWRCYTEQDSLVQYGLGQFSLGRSGAAWVGGICGVSCFRSGVWSYFDAPCSQTTPPLETQDGSLWVGTSSGVYRFDGSRWVGFTSVQGQPMNNVSRLYEGPDGTLWATLQLGTPGLPSAVATFDGTRWNEFLPWREILPTSISEIHVDAHGVRWFTTNSGVYRHASGTWKASLGSGDTLVCLYVNGITEAPSGDIWLRTCSAVRYLPDRVAPQTALRSRPAALSSDRNPIVEVEAGYLERVGVQFDFSLDGGEPTNWSTSGVWRGQLISDGDHELRCRAQDFSQNVDASPVVVRFTIDATPPSPSILFPGPNASVRDSITIRGTAADARFGFYRLETRALGAAAWTVLVDTTRTSVTNGVLGGWSTRALEDGIHELRLTVADTLGLVGTQVIPVAVDNRFPYAAQTSPALVTAATGGDIYTTDASAHLYIPPHGLERDTVVTMAALDTSVVPATLPGGSTRVHPGFELDWGTVSLNKTATLDLPNDGESRAVIYFWGADSVWQRVGGTPDPQTQRVTIAVAVPGRYSLFLDNAASANSGTARVSGITMTPRVFSPRGNFAVDAVAIGFTLGKAGAVSVKVYNRAGRLVREVASGLELGAGVNVVRWDGRDRDGKAVEEGAYVVSIGAFGDTQTSVLAVVR